MADRHFTQAEALDEAVLIFTRRMQRYMDGAVFNKVWASLPDGANSALMDAERRADQRRDIHGQDTRARWAPEPDLDEVDGEE